MADVTHEEVELKLRVPSEELGALQRHPRVAELARGPVSDRRVESIYFDTPTFALARAGLVLRLRQDGDATLQTVKTRAGGAAGLFRRGEWEAAVSGNRPDLERIPNATLRTRVEAAVGDDPLDEILRTAVRRTTRSLVGPDWEARFDLDVGEAKTPRGSHPICELELELVRGDATALYDLALELQEDVPLRPARVGKVEAGLALLLGEVPAPVRARRLELAEDASLEDVIHAVFSSCLSQIADNEAPARAGIDPEGVHQLRVGARRLRSALSIFKDVLPVQARREFREELRWLGGELADARDLDVFLAESLESLPGWSPRRDELARLESTARELRETAYARVRAAIDSPRYARLALSLGAFITGRRWRDQQLSPESARLFAPARSGTRPLLARRYDKVRRRVGDDIGALSLSDAHALRIDLKKLRYASDFLGSLYPERRSRKFRKRLGRLQDTLGHLNDQTTAQQILTRALEHEASGPDSGDSRWAAGFVSGWTSRVVIEKLRPLKKDWKAFTRSSPFWSDD